MSDETAIPQDDATEDKKGSSDYLAIITAVESIWPVKLHVLTRGIGALFNRGKLHSVCAVGQNTDQNYITVPLVQWANLRLLSTDIAATSAVFVDTGKNSLVYANWPPHSAMKYPVTEDPVWGAVVRVPKSEFKPVERSTS